MRMFLAWTALLLVAGPGARAQENAGSQTGIRNIETGLVEFTTPLDMLCPGSAQRDSARTLAGRMAFYDIPGAGIAVIDDGRIERVRAYGVVEAGTDRPVTAETLFEAASTTKLVVAAIALHLVERGALDLDADVNAALTSWKVPESAFTRERKVTLRLLLTHRAGLNRPEGGFTWKEGTTPTLLQTLNGEPPVENPPAVVESVPGSRWSYSNFGYLVIQQLIEDVTREPFPDVARRVVFEPLGMESSTFEAPLPAGFREREALPHDAEGTAHASEMHPKAVANGGLMTTPTDLAIFTLELMRAWRGESDRVISRETARRMFHRETEIDPAALGVPLGEGLGTLLFGDGPDFFFLHPGDNMPGSSCWLMGLPGSAAGIVIMTNGAKGNLLAMEIVASVIRGYDWPAPCESRE